MLGKLWSWLGSFLSDKVPMEARLESDLEGMLKALDAKADIVAFSMARAEEAQEKLRLELENHDGLEAKAAQFLAAATRRRRKDWWRFNCSPGRKSRS